MPPKSKSAGEAVVGNEPQTITFEEIPSHNVWDPSFEVKVRSSSSLPVTITVKSGPATVSGSTVTIYESGTVQLEASQPGDSTYQAAKPVDRTFAVAEDDDYCVPGLIAKPEPPAKKATRTEPGTIIAWLGNPVPFSFEALGKGQIAIYSSIPKSRLSSHQAEDLKEIEQRIDELEKQSDLEPPAGSSKPLDSSPSAKPTASESAKAAAFNLEVAVPHASALGSNLAAKLTSLRSDTFKAQLVGGDKILITSAKAPSCHDATVYLRDIRRLAWQPSSTSPVAHEYHLASPSDVISALGGGGSSPSPPSASGAKPASSSTASTSASGAKPASGSPSSSSASGTKPTPGASSDSDTSNDSDASPGSANPNASDDTASAKQAAPSPSTSQKSSASAALINPDLFLFQTNTPGDDAEIAEKKRILAQIDLPRPEVLINTWSMQASTTDARQVGNSAPPWSAWSHSTTRNSNGLCKGDGGT